MIIINCFSVSVHVVDLVALKDWSSSECKCMSRPLLLSFGGGLAFVSQRSTPVSASVKL
jgi:hypothetical protein